MFEKSEWDTEGFGFLEDAVQKMISTHGRTFPIPEPGADVYLHPIVDDLREYLEESDMDVLESVDDSIVESSELTRGYVAAAGSALEVLCNDPSPRVRIMVALQGECLDELEDDSDPQVKNVAVMMKQWLVESEWTRYVYELVANPDWVVILDERDNRRVSTIQKITGSDAEHALSTDGEECLNSLVECGILDE